MTVSRHWALPTVWLLDMKPPHTFLNSHAGSGLCTFVPWAAKPGMALTVPGSSGHHEGAKTQASLTSETLQALIVSSDDYAS